MKKAGPQSIERGRVARIMARSRGLFVALAAATALATSSAAVHADEKTDKADAEKHFFSGQKLYGDKQYHDALAEFRASYELVKSPNSHLYVARALRELGMVGAAFDEYGLVIAEANDKGPKYAATKKAAKQEQDALKDRIATVKLTIPADAKLTSVRVGSRNVPLERASEPISAEAGTVVVRVDATDRKTFEWRKDLKAGDSETVTVDLPPGQPSLNPADNPDAGEKEKPEEKGQPLFVGPLRPLALVSAGVGVAGLVVWGVFGVKASNRFDDLNTRCGGTRCPPSEQSSVDAGRRETTASTIGLVVGAVGLGAGVALWFLGAPPKNKAAPAQDSGVSLRISPSPRASTVSLGGVF